MLQNVNIHDEIEDMQRKLAFAEACADPLDFDQLLIRASALLNKWAQADVVTLILPPERADVEPMLHIFGRQPVLPLAERSIRDECALLLSELDFAHLSGEALRLRRGPELMPLHSPVRDDYMYRFWSQEMEHEGQVVGIVSLFGFTDWLISPRLRRLLNALVPTLGRAVANAAAVANLRLCAHKDEVSGAYNRRGFMEVLDRQCAQTEAMGQSSALLLFEVEEYPQVAGTPDGAALLRSIGEVVRATMRPYDIFGELGENEFTVFMPAIAVEEITPLAEQLIADLGTLKCQDAEITVNVGAALYEGGAAEHLVQAADEALYQAKREAALAEGQVG